MPNRTANANKAIAARWVEEQQLVHEGKGTRDWTPEQQQDIRERGKAYDSDGKAFEGHHMKSVEMHPEYQGDPGNIQFLSRSEHINAHNGSYQNPTNGCFNPFTGETSEFGDNEYKACEVITLSDPISVITESSGEHIATKNDDTCSTYSTTQSSEDDAKGCEPEVSSTPKWQKNKTASCVKNSRVIKKSVFLRNVKRVTSAVKDYAEQHPILTNIVYTIGGYAVKRIIVKTVSSVIHSADGGSSASHSSYANKLVATIDAEQETKSTHGKGAPKEPHDTSGYTRTRNGRIEHVKGYSTGKKPNE